MEEREKATIEQLYEQLGNNFDITICSDIANGLYFEYKQLYYENEQLKEQLELSEKARKEAIDYINFLVIIDAQLAGGRFKDTIWGKELLEILDIDKGEWIWKKEFIK